MTWPPSSAWVNCVRDRTTRSHHRWLRSSRGLLLHAVRRLAGDRAGPVGLAAQSVEAGVLEVRSECEVLTVAAVDARKGRAGQRRIQEVRDAIRSAGAAG